MKVTIFRATDGACDLYRAVLPLQTAAENKKIVKKELWMQNIIFDMFYKEKEFSDAMDADIFLLQRINSDVFINKIASTLKENKLPAKVVVDYDDDIFNVSPLSNHYVDYGTENAKIFHKGQLIHEWKDGLNINLEKNRKMIEGAKKAVSLADLVTVTTENLAEVYRQYNGNVKILPNTVDLSDWNRLEIKRDNPDEIRIAWAGGHSHWEDLYLIREPLIEIAKKYPNVKILMIGYIPKGMEKDFRPGQVEFHPWKDTAAHPFRLASLDIDIGLIPLKNTIFNRCKSPIKWIEYSALQIPSIASYISPYKEMEALSENNGIYIEENDTKGWVNGLELLIKDAQMRRRMGQAAREVVKAHFDINTQYERWIKTYEEVLCPSLQIQR